MTQKSCAVGMHNAKLGNHLKLSFIDVSPVQYSTQHIEENSVCTAVDCSGLEVRKTCLKLTEKA